MSFDRSRDLERTLPRLFAELAGARTPDYLEAAIERASSRPQRPAWTFPERWIPVQVATSRVPVARMPWRQLGVLALIAILLAAALAVYIGSRPQRLPPPFGQAATGLVAFEQGGDIYTADPGTGKVMSIIASPTIETGPRFSRDGTHLVFARNENGGTNLFVALMDGSGVTLITSEPVQLTRPVLGEPWEQYQFSPDGKSVLIASLEGGIAGISIAQSDGSGIRRLEVGMAAYEPSFRPPNGREILFIGGTDANGIFVVDVGSETVRTIVAPEDMYGLASANWSPDGSKIAYWRWGGPGHVGGINARTHVVSADGSDDHELPKPADAVWDAGSEWSNDGTRLVTLRGYTDGYADVRLVVRPVEESSTGTEIPFEGTLNAECCASFEWAPDDAHILLTPSGSSGQPLTQWIVDVGAGQSRPAAWNSTSDPTWQRIAR